MSTGFNTDLQSILNNAKSQLSSLGVNGALSSSGNNYLNSVWGLVQDGQSAIDGNDQQKAQAISSIVQNLMSMIMSLGTNENSKATQEVSNNDNNAAKVQQGADKKADEIKAALAEAAKNIDSNSNNISSAIDKIKEIGGQEDVENAKEELDKQVEIIEQNLKIVNDGVSSPEAKQNALENIKNASAAIGALTEKMSFLTKDVQAQIQEQNTIIENATNNLASLFEETATTLQNGTFDLQSFVQKAVQEIGVNTKTSITGAANETVGATATASGGATSWVPIFGQTASTKLMQIGADQTAAGATRIAGSVATLSQLTKAIGKIGSDNNEINGLAGNIQGVGNGAIALVGEYQTRLESIITATGSWTQVVEANAELQNAISEYEAQISGSSNKKYTQYNFGGTQQQDNNNAQPQQNNGVLNFDSTRFKASFGI